MFLLSPDINLSPRWGLNACGINVPIHLPPLRGLHQEKQGYYK